MKNRLRILVLGFLIIPNFVLEAQDLVEFESEPETPDVVEEVVDGVETSEPADTVTFEIDLPDYEPWERVTLNGKLKMQGLPLSPSVKIFMEYGKLVNISLRAPFLGEVGRLDLTPESLTIVNKMNKTYVQESFGNEVSTSKDKSENRGNGRFGGLDITNVQDLLLGRFFLPGHDVMEEDLDELVEIFYEDNQVNVIPKTPAEIEGIKYAFAVDEKFNPLLLVVVPRDNSVRDYEVAAEFSRRLSGYDLVFSYSEGNKNYEMTLELKNPEWKGDVSGDIDLGKYRRVTLEEFMRSMR